MKKTLIVIACLLFSGSTKLNAQQYAWTQKANFAGNNKYDPAEFVINNKAYVCTGYSGSATSDEMWEYDPLLNTWSQKANFPAGARFGARAFVLNNKGYVMTGWNDASGTIQYGDLWEYTPSANSWLQKANFSGSPRYTGIAFAINNLGYFGTGYIPLYADFWEYNPTSDSWTQKAAIPTSGRQSAIGFTINNYGYLCTGYTGSSLNDLWEYDPVNNTWTSKANFPGGDRFGDECFVINNKAYAGLGSSAGGTFYSDFWEYDPLSNSWLQITAFPGVARLSGTSFGIGNKGYVGMGRNINNNYLNDFWEYGPVSNSINEIQALQVQFSVFQNSTGNLEINYDANGYNDVMITFYDDGGRIVFSKKLKGRQAEILSLNLSRGAYLYSLTDNNQKIKSGKFIIRKNF